MKEEEGSGEQEHLPGGKQTGVARARLLVLALQGRTSQPSPRARLLELR